MKHDVKKRKMEPHGPDWTPESTIVPRLVWVQAPTYCHLAANIYLGTLYLAYLPYIGRYLGTVPTQLPR